MTLLTKYTTDELGWHRREPTAVAHHHPKIWRVVDGKKPNPDGSSVPFTIQEIPENRFEDVLDLMSNVMTQDEPTCASLSTKSRF